ncbi:hypothetical protein BSKO_11433 [Bryopsis sp. KO-2023]|nr:hypothetical protein BSKO_11433 [Bryopsis sp. KO-2023]
MFKLAATSRLYLNAGSHAVRPAKPIALDSAAVFAVIHIKNFRSTGTWTHHEVQLPEEELKEIDAEVEAWVDNLLKNAPPETEEVSSPQDSFVKPSDLPVDETETSKTAEDRPKKQKTVAGTTPAWALTTEMAKAAESMEENDLLKFAEGLDFDRFVSDMDDVEVKEALQAIQTCEGEDARKEWKKQFVRALNHITAKQLNSENGEAVESVRSVLGGLDIDDKKSDITRATTSFRSKISQPAKLNYPCQNDESRWDASTQMGDNEQTSQDKSSTRMAEEILFLNPEMKTVHSIASARSLVEQNERVNCET